MDHLCFQGFAVILMVLYPGTLAVPLGEVTTPEITRGSNGKMTLRFSALGMNLEFHLNPDDGFLRPGVNIGRVHRAGEEEEGVDGLRSCFYSSQEPFAAFSMCKGVQGAFLHGRDSYIIQPTDKWTGQGPLGQHLVFKARNGDTESWGSRTAENNQEEIKNPEQKSAGASGAKTKNARGGKQDLNAGEEPHDGDQVPPRLSERDGGDVQGQGPLDGSRGDRNPNISPRQTQTWTTLEKSKNGTQRSGAARPQSRNRRFVSVDRFVEILLVADTSMVQFYGEDLKLHLLTLMSVAARIYKHPSLQNSVSLVVVKVLVVEDEDAGPDVSDNAGLTLRNFCNWQQGFNPPSDRHSEHYDTAILLTRQDICGHKSCGTLGVADIGTVCDPSKSCSVIEDDGLQASYTLAHELAHVLSIPHDNSKNCEKTFGELGQHHLMAPLFLQLNKSVPWSPCSAMHLTEFLDSGYGGCLLDAPSVTLELPEDLPGSLFLYDLDSQCRQVFGKEFWHCPNTHQKDVCAQLWCKIEGEHVCHTKNGSLHWADGTACGDHRLCLDGVCVDENYAKPKVSVDGNWGSWGPWGECSRTCGGGVRFSYRECNSPEPQNGGRYCNGQRVLYESCNTDECPAQDQSFREQQCAKYNRMSSDAEGRALEWIPKYSGVSPRDRCKLVCRARGAREFKVFQSKVVDGTLCGPESLSVCVQGQCIKAGCDHVLGSSKKLDKCARCGGDGSTCRKISGSFNKSNVRYGYNDIVHIPVGATNIDIKQSRERGLLHHSNYLAIKKADESYLLNGDIVSLMEQDLHLKGTILKYSGSSTKLERIQSFSPLPEPLTIQLRRGFGETVPLKVKYTFYVPKVVPYARTKVKKKEKVSHHSIRPLLTSNWVFGDWSQCSKTCGSGWQRRTVECQNVEGGASDQCSQELRPEDIQPCSKLPCPIWRVGSWSPCSKSCGEGTRTKRVFCADYTGKETDADKCDPKKRPAEELTSCMLDEC
ncbi:A disintegrin and metalloproteinase with thrombospondin motifs 8 [Spea bombifrons]|uniref:A disintegrin and metalloproteinase with thrombospondin motifs 8 n=1 Tax=Spea bombifrons TaxID=233779 RepID=UPI00234AB205|nr:A disintegrin and metalloproteinase with thrombospondin motifs 8 [Spea bombifrons]